MTPPHPPAYHCAAFTVLSFNFGIPQEKLESAAKPLRRAIETLHKEAAVDFVFGSELGDSGSGFAETTVDFPTLVRESVPRALGQTSGAYAALWNFGQQDVNLVISDTQRVGGTSHPVHMMTSIFDLTADVTSAPTARQHAARPPLDSVQKAFRVFVIVGNVQVQYIPGGSRRGTRRVLKWCLDHLAKIGCGTCDDAVVRLLVGGSDLCVEEAQAAMQDPAAPASSSPLQRDAFLTTWQLLPSATGKKGDMLFAMGAFPATARHCLAGMSNAAHDPVSATLYVPVLLSNSGQAPGASQPEGAADTVGAAQPSCLSRSAQGEVPPGASPPVAARGHRLGPPAGGRATRATKSSGHVASSAAAPPSLHSRSAQRGDQRRATEPLCAVTTVGVPPPPPARHVPHAFAPPVGTSSKGRLPCPRSGLKSKASPPASPYTEASRLHQAFKELEEDDTMPPEIVRELARLLFMKRTQMVHGHPQPYIASSAETLDCIQKLLDRRNAFMRAHKLQDDGENKYIFSHPMRAAIFKEWKDEFHADNYQRELQRRDSWKPITSIRSASQRPPFSGSGSVVPQPSHSLRPNKEAVRRGKHSRFARHLQRVGGSKQIVEVILFTGCADIEMLRKAAGPAATSPAESLAARPENAQLKRTAFVAKQRLREGNRLVNLMGQGKLDDGRLAAREKQLLQQRVSGELLRDANSAIIAYGHGTLRSEDGTSSLALGGSTGGRTRAIIDNWKPIPHEELQRFKRPRDHDRDEGLQGRRYKRPRSD